MQKATGQSIDDTIKDFVKLAEEPTKASVKLNEQFHYLTGAVYEQIAALEEILGDDKGRVVGVATERLLRADAVLGGLAGDGLAAFDGLAIAEDGTR